MNQPERFDLTCVNEKGEKERIVMIHCAIMGSIERFSAVLIEHLGGNFPLWLSPVQIRVLPVSDKHHGYAREVLAMLIGAGVRAEIDDASESLGKKIRATKNERLPYFLVIGDKEIESQTVTLESRDSGSSEALGLEDFLARITSEIQERA
jgi:threonyl-tRNA synthetase